MDRNSRGLGSRLVQAGHISEAQLEQSLSLQMEDGTLLGETLVNHGMISEEELSSFIFTSPGASLGEALIGSGYITREQLAEALSYQQQYGGRLGAICVSQGFITEGELENALGRRLVPKAKLGEELFRLGIITQGQLDAALEMQERSGGRLGEILIFLEFITEEQLYRILANQGDIGRPGSDINLKDVQALPYEMANRYNAVTLREADSYVLVAVRAKLDAKAEKEMEAYFGKRMEQVLMTDEEGLRFWEQAYRRREIVESIFSLYEEQPENSALVTFTTPQIVALLAMLAVFLLSLAINWYITLLTLVIVFQIIYLLMAVGKLWILIKGAMNNAQLRFMQEEVDNIDEAELPVYTLLIPVYKE